MKQERRMNIGVSMSTATKKEKQRYAFTGQIITRGDDTSAEAVQRLRTSHEDHLENRVDQRMKEIQGCISGISSPSVDRVCLLIEFCYLLELHEQAVDLHTRLDRNNVKPDWLRRVDRIVRASKMKL